MLDFDFDREARLRFLNIDTATVRRLADTWPIVQPHLAGILDGFYRHVMAVPMLAEKIGGAATVTQLKAAQDEHWRSLFTVGFDQAYVDRVKRIGMAHFRIGLEPRWYMAGYAFIVAEITSVITNRYRKKPDEAAAARTAAVKAIFLDMDLSISVYHDAMNAEQRKLTDRSVAFVREVRHVVDGVSAAATELQATSECMTQNAEQGVGQSTAVAAASEQASANVQTVASAAEELSASLQEVARQVNQSSDVTHSAVAQTQTTNQEISGLSSAAERIGAVVNLIQDIASQTNLLALNATIEAARAGEAGKGFAVVASEVKTLASQTAKATEDIRRQIGGMQEATSRAVAAIAAITATINQVNEIASAIAAVVEQQNAATQEITRNVQQAASGTRDVSANLALVSRGLSQSGLSAGEVLHASAELSRQSEGLKRSIDTFLADLASAA